LGDKVRYSPIFGTARGITSDSWGITVLQFFAQCEANFPLYNMQISSDGANALLYGFPAWDITILGRPTLWGFLFLGKEMGLSWFYCSRLLGLLLVSYETLNFLTEKNKKLAALGAILIAFSPMAQWWGTHNLPEIILHGEMIFVSGYYYFENSEYLWKKILFALLMLISLIGFILLLYPAIAVPFGIVVLLMAASYLWMQRKEIKFYKSDLILLGTVFFLAAVIIGRFIYISINELNLLANTVSPGRRFMRGGEFNIDLLFMSYFQWILPFKDVPAYNNCEVSGIMPLSTIILISFPFVINKDAQRRLLNIALYSFFVCCICWLIFIFPYKFAKYTLFYNVTGNRLMWTIGLLSIYLTFIMADYLSRNEVFSLKSTLIVMFGVLLIFVFAYQKTNIITFIISNKKLYALIAALFLLLLTYSLMQWKKVIFICLCFIFTFVAGFNVLPVNKGLSGLYDYDFSKKINEIKELEPDALWFVNGHSPMGNYLVSYGVNTFNATNLYPDYSKWKKIDGDEIYRDIYNRYAQVSATIDTATNFQLLHADQILITVSLSGLKSLGVNYIFSLSKLDYSELKLIYEDSNASVWIYKVNII
jgi:hypothetical protein